LAPLKSKTREGKIHEIKIFWGGKWCYKKFKKCTNFKTKSK